jgi:hypothetical protein
VTKPIKERSSEDVKKALLRRLSNKAVREMSIPQVASVLRTVSKKGRAKAPASIAEDIEAARARFKPVDLSVYRTKEVADESTSGD